MKDASQVKTIMKYAGLAMLILVMCSAYVYRKSVISLFDLSFITEKCLVCNFQNRHHCNLCKAEQRQCPFCDNGYKITNK